MKIPKQLQKKEYRFVRLNGKMPIDSDWTNTNNFMFDDNKIKEHKNNIGVACGKGGICVIDIDGNAESTKELIFKHLPKTYAVKTGKKGFHLYYLTKEEFKTTAFSFNGSHIDIKATGGQVVMEGSIHPETKKKYECVEDNELVTIDEKVLIDFFKINEPKEKTETIKEQTIDKSAIEFGEIIRLLEKGKSKQEIYTFMQSFVKWSGSTEEYKNYTYNKALSLVGTIKPKELTPLSFNEFMNIEDHKEYYIKNMFAKGTINMIFSPPAQMKSFISYYMALCLATGTEMLNQRTKKVNVCYFDWENPFSDVQSRVKGICKGMDLDCEKIDSLFFFPKQPVLLKAEKFDAWVYSDLRDQLIKFIKDNEIKVIFFDTFRRLGNFDENDSQAINTIKSELFDFLIKETEVCIVFLHHTSKAGENYRGSVDIEGILDTAFKVEKKEKDDILSLNIKNTKRRNNEIQDLQTIVDIQNVEYEYDGDMLEKIESVVFKRTEETEDDANKNNYSLYRSWVIDNLDVSNQYKNKELTEMFEYNFGIKSASTISKILKWLVEIGVLISIGEKKNKYYTLNSSNKNREEEIQFKDIEKHFKNMFQEVDIVKLDSIRKRFSERITSIFLNEWISKGWINTAKADQIQLTELGKSEIRTKNDIDVEVIEC